MKGKPMRSLVLLLVAALLSACGFHLRGSYTLPWDTLHIGLPEFDIMRAELKRGIEASTQTRIVDDAKEARARLIVTGNAQTRNILSLSAKGLVREVQLTRIFSYRVIDKDSKDLAAPGNIVLQREMTFDDEQLLAKGSEEGLILKEMQSDLVQQLLRRLAAAKPPAPQ